jgi:hypothetical protein
MTSPLPRAIAYAAVQVGFASNSHTDESRIDQHFFKAYFQLSSTNLWCQEIEDLDLVDLYDRIVEMFEGNANKTWVDETLQHWKA